MNGSFLKVNEGVPSGDAAFLSQVAVCVAGAVRVSVGGLPVADRLGVCVCPQVRVRPRHAGSAALLAAR